MSNCGHQKLSHYWPLLLFSLQCSDTVGWPGDRKGTRPVKHRALVCWWWQFDYFQWLWVTFDPDFKVTTFFDIEYLTTRDRASYYRTPTGSRMHSIEWWYFQWPWRTPNLFSRSRHFWSRISQKWCVLGTKLLKNSNRKPYTIYRMVALSMTLIPISMSGH